MSMAWLPAETSLACLLRDQGRSADAVACLRLIYDRFTDSFDTADDKEYAGLSCER